MKTFAAAVLLSASASASMTKLINFDFSEYFTKSEPRVKPALSSYMWDYSVYLPNDAKTEDYGFAASLSGDLNVQYSLPFDNTDNDLSWYVELKPEISLGGQQSISLITPYFVLDIYADIWPFELLVGDTYLQWDPPLFANFCMSSGWSMTLLDLYFSMDVALYECDSGVFDWILNGNSYNCALQTYTFNNNLFEIAYSAADMSGEFLANTCDLLAADETTSTGTTTIPDSTTDTTTLNNVEWF